MCGQEINGPKKNVVSAGLNESALVSFVLGIALFIMAPLTLNFNVNLWSEGPCAGPTMIPMSLAYPAGMTGLILILCVAVANIIFGIRGWVFALKQAGPKTLALAAMMVSIVAFLLWIVVAVDLVMILTTFLYVRY